MAQSIIPFFLTEGEALAVMIAAKAVQVTYESEGNLLGTQAYRDLKSGTDRLEQQIWESTGGSLN